MNNDTIPSQLGPITIPSALGPVGAPAGKPEASSSVSPAFKWALAVAGVAALWFFTR